MGDHLHLLERTKVDPKRMEIQVTDAPVVSQMPVKVIIGHPYYILMPGTPVLPSSAPLRMGNSKSCSRKMRIKGPHDPNTPYIKKPLNAFMLFMKEQRPLVKPKMIKRDSPSVNQVLGQMWKSLTVAERQYYFNESERLKNIHAIEYPNWSSGDNYGLKKGRVWCSKASKLNNPIVSPPELPPPVGSSIMQEGPQCDLISTVLGELEAMDPSTSTIPILNSEPDADLTSMLFEELEAMELAEVSSTDSSSSSSLDAGPDPDLTTVLF